MLIIMLIIRYAEGVEIRTLELPVRRELHCQYLCKNMFVFRKILTTFAPICVGYIGISHIECFKYF